MLADPEHGIHRVGVPYGIDVADDAPLQKITGNEREQHLTERLDVGALLKLPGGVGMTDEIGHRPVNTAGVCPKHKSGSCPTPSPRRANLAR